MRLHIPLTLLMAIRCVYLYSVMDGPSSAHLRFEQWTHVDLNNVWFLWE